MYVLLMPECALCNSAMILLRAGLGITIFALSFIRSSVPFSGSAMESVLKTLAYSCRGELSVGEACFPVCRSSAAAFVYALSSAASVMMLRAGSLEILRQCIVSSMSLGSSSSSAAEKTGVRDNASAM